MSAFLDDPVHVYAVAFALFLVLSYLFARKPLLRWLDSEIAKISTELTTARELREEAEAALAECKIKQQQAELEAQKILKMATEQADSMRAKAEAELATSLERQQKMAKERIQLAEDKAVSDVRDAAAKLGVDLARKMLTSSMKDADAARLIDEAIDEMPVFKTAK